MGLARPPLIVHKTPGHSLEVGKRSNRDQATFKSRLSSASLEKGAG